MQGQSISGRLFLILLSLLWLFSALKGSSPEAQAQGGGNIFNFDQTLDPGGIGANAVALGDLDGDGDLDAYLGLKDSAANKIYLNNNGAFSDSGQGLIAASTLAVALGDLDRDGDLDAFVANAAGESDLIEKNGGNGVIQSSLSLSGSDAHATNAVALGDLDGDNDLDALVVTDQNSHLWINQGGVQGGLLGQFQTGQILGTAAGADVVLADLDNDTDLDAVVLTNFNQAFQVWTNNSGTFQLGATLPFEAGTLASGLAVGFINNDDLPDLYIAIPTGNDLIGLNNGSNSFNPGQSLPIGNSQMVVLADVDLDGDQDATVAVWEYGNSGDQVWLNEGGIFSQAQVFSDSRSVALATGDVDNDTTPDVLLANLDGPKKLWLNESVLAGTDLSVAISGPEIVFEYEEVDYDVAITVQGQTDATNVIVSKSGGSWVGLGGCGAIGDCNIDFIMNGTTVNGKIQKTILTPDKYYEIETLTVDVSSDEPDPNLINNTAQMVTHIYGCKYADCAVEEVVCLALEPPDDANRGVGQGVQSNLQIPVFYQIRDDVLGANSTGQRYRDLYYTHDAELQSLILNDTALLSEAVSVLSAWQPNLQSLVDGEGYSAIITANQVAAMNDFLTSLSRAGSPTLQQVIADELETLGPLNDYVGLSMAEARLKLLGGPLIYLPTVIK